MRTLDSASPYRVVPAPFESSAFDMHLRMVADTYSQKGFIASERKEDLVDAHDSSAASYCLLYSQATETLAGTFRIIPGTSGLPLLAAFPHVAITGIPGRFCECTRVVSTNRGLDRSSGPLGAVLCEALVQSMAYARAHDLFGMVSLGSPRIFERVNAAFFGIQHALAVPRIYQGGIVIPSLIWAEEFEYSMMKHTAHLQARYASAREAWLNQ